MESHVTIPLRYFKVAIDPHMDFIVQHYAPNADALVVYMSKIKYPRIKTIEGTVYNLSNFLHISQIEELPKDRVAYAITGL